MKVSVIIPVYNAEKYLQQAVESSLAQEECGEVILVEDKSPDNALEICKSLVAEYDNVYLYQHENNLNMGPGPSRNLGVMRSRFDYIAFLDADDIYLPGRFKKAAKLLINHCDLDGIYEPVGSSFENKEAQRRYFATHSGGIAMVTKTVEPEDLFECLISGKNGYIHPNGLLIKKKAFLDAGMYPELRLHEDTILNLKLSLLCNLAPGEMNNPVSIRKLHMNNIITKPGINYFQSRYSSFENLLAWMLANNIEDSKKKMVAARFYQLKYKLMKQKGKMFLAIIYYIYYLCKYRKHAFWLKYGDTR